MSQILVKNLSTNRAAFEGLNFSCEKGEFIAIVGKSGSGKTTFLQCLASLISFDGEISIPKHIGMVFQHYAVFPWMTVEENIGFGLDKGVYADIDKKRIIDEHLNMIGLEHKRKKYPAELSGGQIQRAALARSLAPNPDILLMDEPYSALDSYTRDKMQEWLLNTWSKHKKTIIFVTHNIEEAVFLADRVLLLDSTGIKKEFNIPFARPRHESIKFTNEFNELRKGINDAMQR